jgi:cytosine/adenosine deaminase-related metal-dependent hydrolase
MAIGETIRLPQIWELSVNREYALRARWIVPVDAPPIDGGVVTVIGDRIAAVGKQTNAARVFDLGDAALLPGFVNAHTHLELGDVRAPLGSPGMSLPEWIGHVVAWRRDRAGNPNCQRDAVRAGLAQSLAAGVTMLGDIVQADWPREEFAASPIRSTAFLELIGLSEQRVAALEATATAHLATACRANCRPGLSPHAPYSVRPSLLPLLPSAPLAMHIAESREELELLAAGRGPFRARLEQLGAWQEGLFGGTTPLDALRLLANRAGDAPTLVVHGNYLEREAWSLLADRRRRMSVVYCPRTHAYFRHERYPLVEMWQRGVRVAVGTDSRASNPDLSVLAELRHVARNHVDALQKSMPRDAALKRILGMGTQDAAAALGDADGAGSIAVGKRADLAVVSLDASPPASNVLERLLFGNGAVIATIAAGRVIHDPYNLVDVPSA